jgi:nucleoid DNA-binding protein
VSKRLIIYKLANKYNLPLKKIEEIVNYQFKYVTKIMKEGNFDSIRLPYFGKFSVKSARIEYINKLKNDKKS